MSKQVRIRRGTTVQHATFTGADGEVTFDTTRKCLVVHDGTTAGGHPVDAVVLSSAGTFAIQTINSSVLVTGDDGDSVGLRVAQRIAADGGLFCQGLYLTAGMRLSPTGRAPAGTQVLDFAAGSLYAIPLAGDC